VSGLRLYTLPARLLLAIALAFIIQHTSASAQVCNFTITSINFGNVNMAPGGTAPTSGTLTATCSGKPGATITICPNIGDGTGGSNNGSPRLMKNGTASIPYDLLQPNGQVWGSYVWPYAARPPVLSTTLNRLGTGTLTQTIQAQISGSIASAPTGHYLSSYTTIHTLLDYGYAPAQSCNVVSTRAAQANFIVQAQDTATCNLSATAMNFGTLAGLTTAQATSNQIGITCTIGAAYTISLDNGINGGTGPSNRYMVSATNQKLSYGIFKDAAHVQAWGSTTGSNTQAGTGNGTTQNITAYALLPAQGNPMAGTYSDTVVVTVNY
jgi:spore coat protein U-like protein